MTRHLNSPSMRMYSTRLTENYDYDLTSLLIEILTKEEPIKLDSDYLSKNGEEEIDSQNMWKYKDDPVFVELKSDMEDFCNDIKKEILKIEGVDSVTIKPSQSVGLSTYITVQFTKPPRDSKLNIDYLAGYGNEYKLKFRLSNHDVTKATDADVRVDLLGKKYAEFQKEVLDIVKQRVQQLDNYYRDFKKTKKVSASQKQRNKDRNTRKQAYKDVIMKKNKYGNKGYNNDSGRKKTESYFMDETFGGDRLIYMLHDDTIDYLDAAHVNVEDIVDNIEHHFGFDINYIELLKTAAKCLNDYVLEYTFDDNLFDYDLLFRDMEKLLKGLGESRIFGKNRYRR